MEVNKIYSGFQLLRKEEVKDYSSVFYEFKHLKSGASLVFLENNDDNKCFAAGFRTLPNDSTGVCHIIEHSLLCGSKKYPLKEPFVNLLKGSMATFLNAMTASDFTIYPVASQNNKDFKNLMDVYLDAVFNPLSVLDPKAFLQEGWHLEMEDMDSIPSYKGVVYNEMKGAMSSVDEQLMQLSLDTFYAGSRYGLNSGGDPEVIPTLTYEAYKDFYHKHYSPSNCMLYLYGNLDINERLEYLDKEYLSHFEALDKLSIDTPKPLINLDSEREYAISPQEELEDNTFMSLGFALDKYENARDLMGFQILNDALTSSNDAPLKKALLESNLGQDVQTMINTDCILPSYFIFLQKTNKEEKERFYQVFMDTCKNLVKDGIPKDLLLATINNTLFSLKEMDSGTLPKGFATLFDLMQCYLYDVPYLSRLAYTENFEFFKEALNNGYFEGLIEKYILNSKHYVLTVLNPSQTLAQEKEAEMERAMTALAKTLSEEEKARLVKQTKDLIAYQNSVDSEEAVRSLPTLTMDDVSKEVKELKTTEEANYLVHNFDTSGIGYLRLYFDLSVLSEDEIKYAALLANLLGFLDTKNYSAVSLQSKVKTYLGTLGFSLLVKGTSKEDYLAKFVVNVSSLKENISYMSEVLNEILNETIFDDKKISQNLFQYLNILRQQIIESGNSVAFTEARKANSKEGYLLSLTGGLAMYDFLDNLTTNYEDLKANFILNLKNVLNKLMNKFNLIASVSGDEEIIEALKMQVSKLNLSNQEVSKALVLSGKVDDYNATAIPAQVSYNAKAINLKDINEKRTGALEVTKSILDFEYLWVEVRVKGGAYGCSSTLSSCGDLGISSFRDPNVKNTYEVYDKISTYLENLDLSEDEITTYKIGTLGNLDKPMSNSLLIAITDTRYFMGLTLEKRQELKAQMINTTLEDVKAQAKIFKLLAQMGNCYTVGNEKKIKEYERIAAINSL